MQHERHRVPVTALAFWGQDVVLAGEGPYLKAYGVQEKNLLASVRVFDDQAVHGILVQETFDHGRILLWGGNLVQAVSLERLSHGASAPLRIQQGETVQATDWILDAAIWHSTEQGASKIAVVTAHNALALTNQDRGSLKLSFRTAVPGSNCILYCAHITWLSALQCLIASGTAFGDIIVWSCQIAKDAEGSVSATYQVHYTFSAHQGSVFGVHLASRDVSHALDGRQHVLASCSDDRTICLWDVSDLTVHSATLAEEQRETGFGSKQSSASHKPPLLSKTMGHVSRIWHVRLQVVSTPHGLAELRILSFGEDATCITWKLSKQESDGSAMQYQFKPVRNIRAHSGKHIWSVAVDNSSWLATGGADGAIALLPGGGSLNCSLSGPPEVQSHSIDGAFRSFAFSSSSEVLAINENGKVITFSTQLGQATATAIATGDARLNGYSIATSAAGTVFFAGTAGIVYSYCHTASSIKTVAVLQGKIAGLFAQAVKRESQTDLLSVLVTTVNSQSATLLHFDKDGIRHADVHGAHNQSYELQLPEGLVVTSYARFTYGGRSVAALGARNGHIALFLLPDEHPGTPLSASSCKPVHDKEAVTSLKVLPVGRTSDDSLYLLSTGRDGTYTIQKVRSLELGEEPETVHRILLPFGPNIEGIDHTSSGQLLVWGFRSKSFVVFDLISQQEIMIVDCGGVHRNWRFRADHHGGTFIWTQASKLHYHSQRQLGLEILESGGHGREIKSLAVSPVDSSLVATGAEDTNIKLSRYINGDWRCLHTLQKHVTGIQHLQWSRDGCYLFSSGGFEEFFVWRLRSCMPVINIGVVCESAHPRSSTSDLRIMSFNVQSHEENVRVERGAFSITMVYSDSTIRKWQYQDLAWLLMAQGDYLTSCLTQCLHLKLGGSSIVTGSTDGYMTKWNAGFECTDLSWSARHHVHQNAILSLIQHRLGDQSTLLISGGDDNALGITHANVAGDTWETLLIPRAHAAAVTGLAVINSKDDALWLVSTGIDQRVKLWKVIIDSARPGIDGVDVKLLDNAFTAVADVSGIEKVELQNGGIGVLICGVGLDLWRIDEDILRSAST